MSTSGTPQSPGTEPWPPTTGATGAEEGGSGAKDRAKEAAGTAKEQAQNVAGTAKDQAQSVLEESKQQAKGLLDDAQTQVEEQSRVQRDRVVETLRSFSADLENMVNGEPTGGGLAQDLARQVAGRARDMSSRLEGREPAELLEEVRGFARRRPGTFLLGALAAGVVAGRLTRGTREAQSQQTSHTAPSRTPIYDEVRGTATGAPTTTGTGYPDVPPADPAGPAVSDPGTTMEPGLGTPGATPGAVPGASTPGLDEPGGRGAR